MISSTQSNIKYTYILEIHNISPDNWHGKEEYMFIKVAQFPENAGVACLPILRKRRY